MALLWHEFDGACLASSSWHQLWVGIHSMAQRDAALLEPTEGREEAGGCGGGGGGGGVEHASGGCTDSEGPGGVYRLLLADALSRSACIASFFSVSLCFSG